MSVRLYVCQLVCDNLLFTSQDNTALPKGNNIQSFKNNTRYNITTAYVGLCIVTKANGGYMHYRNVNKTCKSVYNVYTYQIHITQLIITYAPS